MINNNKNNNNNNNNNTLNTDATHPQHIHSLLHIIPKCGDHLFDKIVTILTLPLEPHHAQPHMQVGNKKPRLKAVWHMANYTKEEKIYVAVLCMNISWIYGAHMRPALNEKFSSTALRRQRCDRNTQRNNLLFLHGTATYSIRDYV